MSGVNGVSGVRWRTQGREGKRKENCETYNNATSPTRFICRIQSAGADSGLRRGRERRCGEVGWTKERKCGIVEMERREVRVRAMRRLGIGGMM